MNVLFLSDNPPLPTNGGVENVVSILSSAFIKDLGWNCHSVFFYGECDGSEFTDLIHVDLNDCEADLLKIITHYHIDVVLNNVMSKHTANVIFPALKRIKEKDCPNLIHIFTFHSYPCYELIKQHIPFLWKKMMVCGPSVDLLKNLFSQLVLRIVPMPLLERKMKRKYATMTMGVDRVVCLSGKFKERFVKYSGISQDLVTDIPNPVSLDVDKELGRKEKIVLMVSRMDETSKRLSFVFDVWRLMEEDEHFSDWKLVLVGDGPDRVVYERIAKDYGLKNISFEGRQNPAHYYDLASLFLTMSRYEGMPMTILEAQQNGVVVVGLQSEHFLTLSDFVKDGESGFIAQSQQQMAQILKRLMSDEQLRSSVANQAKSDLSKYDMRVVIRKWKELCELLVKTN